MVKDSVTLTQCKNKLISLNLTEYSTFPRFSFKYAKKSLKGRKRGLNLFDYWHAQDGYIYRDDMCENCTYQQPKLIDSQMVYFGQWNNSLRQGRGTAIIFKNDCALMVYEGYWSNGEVSGQGRATYFNGAVYTGSWY